MRLTLVLAHTDRCGNLFWSGASNDSRQRGTIMLGDPAFRRHGETEKDLVAAARNNDEAAIRSIIRTHNRMLFRMARSILASDDEAEDAVQAAYVRAFTGLSAFRGEARLGTWLGRIVINEALGRLRRGRPTLSIDAIETLHVAEVIPFPMTSASPDPEHRMAQHQIRQILERAIDELPEPFRLVLVARLVEGMSVEDTAELLGLRPRRSRPGCSGRAPFSAAHSKSGSAGSCRMRSRSAANAASASPTALSRHCATAVIPGTFFRNTHPTAGTALEEPMSGRTLGAAFAVLVFAVGTAAAQPANSPAKPNDAQIAHIAYTAGEIDIKAAKQALEKSRNPQVREFAQDMVRDHTAVNEKALASSRSSASSRRTTIRAAPW